MFDDFFENEKKQCENGECQNIDKHYTNPYTNNNGFSGTKGEYINGGTCGTCGTAGCSGTSGSSGAPNIRKPIVHLGIKDS